MSFQTIQDRLAALQETTSQLQTLITRLSELKFQPGSVPLTDASSISSNEADRNVSNELSAEIHETLREQDEDLELLEQQIHDLPSGRPGSDAEVQKKRFVDAINRVEKEVKGCHTAFRKAQLSAKRNLEAAQRLERSLLLQSLSIPPPAISAEDGDGERGPSPSLTAVQSQLRRPHHSTAPKTKDEKLIDATSDVTSALRRTHTLMAAELSRSQFAHDTLKESTAALSQLSQSYDSLDSMLASSRNLVRTLLTSQKSDTWYLETAVYVLLATIGWLIFRRFIYGPAWWLVWLPLKMFYKAWMGVFAAVGLRGTDRVVEMGYGDMVKEAAGSAPGLETAASILGSAATTVISSAATQVSHRIGTRTRLPSGAANPPMGHFVGVGGGGRGLSQEELLRARGDMLEQVGSMVDESQQAASGQGAQEKQEEAQPGDAGTERDPQDTPPNPKKRMWEEDKERAKYENRKKDEL